MCRKIQAGAQAGVQSKCWCNREAYRTVKVIASECSTVCCSGFAGLSIVCSRSSAAAASQQQCNAQHPARHTLQSPSNNIKQGSKARLPKTRREQHVSAQRARDIATIQPTTRNVLGVLAPSSGITIFPLKCALPRFATLEITFAGTRSASSPTP